MRFITFLHEGAVRAGILKGDASSLNQAVIDLGHPSSQKHLGGLVPQVDAFVVHGLDDITQRLADVSWTDEAYLTLGDVDLQAPLLRPLRILGVAHNYQDAIAERNMTPPAAPVIFEKDPATVIGPTQAIVLPQGIGDVTYEAELAAVIGSSAHKVSVSEALAHVAGYAVFNDISASEMIRRDGYLERGKNQPTFGPFGPYLATADEIDDPQALHVQLMGNDNVLQDSTTGQMLFNVAELISRLSAETTLSPGTVIATGTPAGVAAMHTPPAWLRANMTLRASVGGLGTLINPVVEEPLYHG
ncbi:fumarylacetoacetate hydrolase family protein [Aidingimonas lacisalsi]|uniref:fumarylacetoacetate hydrolase family protein n=1 Tax=Aidingimonas lacisalsi TaxID=2604086 RepID=UPI0011D25FBB|nr:fumarylacetoacetate hydrolase family protein [Aidingimonas lacisalsi]